MSFFSLCFWRERTWGCLEELDEANEFSRLVEIVKELYKELGSYVTHTLWNNSFLLSKRAKVDRLILGFRGVQLDFWVGDK